ncbi:MAG: tRNA pseudouridine(38-40) synthase TruA [Ancrocorticia sp.]|uniref:tRNA pseudouridine(38-40) synthase TruA n=1 Tax=Ancrocorticia sp. TaxID=2593684 RepID=UPI003F925584
MSLTVAHLERVRLDLAYDGSGFHGWAAQPGLRTVEGVLSDALATLFRESVALTVAGRTDAGVHARGQVVHVDVPQDVLAAMPGRSDSEPCVALLRRLNALLARSCDGPKGSSDVVVYRAAVVPEEFDARFSALRRTYTYRVCDEPECFDPLRRHDVLWVTDRLNVPAMNRAAAELLGEHDFISYCKPREGATTVRELQRLDAVRRDNLVEITATADAFCHSMVRTLVGSLLKVGSGARDEGWPRRRLDERLRNGEVIVAPPHPLTLQRVDYPGRGELAARAAQTRHVRGACGC